MAQTVTKTFTETFNTGNQMVACNCDLVSETQDGSTWTRTYSLRGMYPKNGTVGMGISIPSNATVTKVSFSNSISRSGDQLSYTNLTLDLPDYGNRSATDANIKAYLNASHPSQIRFYWYFGYVTTTVTRTETTASPQLPTAYSWTAYLSSFKPKVQVTYTVPEEDDSVSYGTSNVWQKCKIYVAADNTWKKVKAYFGTGGSWKQVK